MMNRRTFLAGLAGRAARRFGAATVLESIPHRNSRDVPEPETPAPDSFRQRLLNLGYINGQNMVFEIRGAQWQAERLPELAAELVQLKVDVIVAFTNACAFAAKNATRTIPIVVWGAHGAAETGLVRNLARPENVTGAEGLVPETDTKRVELLKQIVPGLSKLAVLYNPNDEGSPIHLESTRHAARALQVAISPFEVRQPADFDIVLAAAASRCRAASDIHRPVDRRSLEAGCRLRHREWVAICEFKQQAQAGCLLSYGSTLPK